MDTENIADIFDKIYETDALIVKPAGALEIARCQRDLHDISVPALPAEYIEFLKIANGVAWNGFEFFGTYQVTVKKSGYTLTDIVSFNDKQHQNKMGLKQMLLLGRFDDDIYVYNTEIAKYQALDSLTLTEIDTYDTFEDLFVTNVTAYIDYDDDDLPPDDEDASKDEGE